MKTVIGRILSFVIVAVGWLVLGIRIVLELIGYATIPEDAAVANERYRPILLKLLEIPWPWLLGFAMISTILLMVLSWPGTTIKFPSRKDRYGKFATDAWYLIQRLRSQEKAVSSGFAERDMQLPHDLRAYYIDLQACGFQIPREALQVENYRVYCAAHAHYLESIKPFLSRKRIKEAKHTATEVSAFLVQEMPKLLAQHGGKERIA